jgi:ribosome modulation factor
VKRQKEGEGGRGCRMKAELLLLQSGQSGSSSEICPCEQLEKEIWEGVTTEG